MEWAGWGEEQKSSEHNPACRFWETQHHQEGESMENRVVPRPSLVIGK
jgi:hypothetical protein